MNLLGGDTGIGLDQLLDGPSITEPFKNQFDTDAGALDFRLATDDSGIAVDVVTPVHVHGAFLFQGFKADAIACRRSLSLSPTPDAITTFSVGQLGQAL